MSRKNGSSYVLAFRVTKEEVRTLDRIVSETGMNRSEILRKLLLDCAERRGCGGEKEERKT